MIRPFVKQFIEDYITEIEQQDWRRITDRWYDAALFHSLDYDESMFDEFVSIMKHVVGVDFLKDASRAIHDEIYFELNVIVHDHINQSLAPRRGKYKKQIYTDQLVTWLGYSEQEIIRICDAVVSDLGYEYDQNYYYIGEVE